MEKRAKSIFANCAQKPQAILLLNEAHADPAFFYATGFDRGFFHSCAAVLHPDGRVAVLVPKLEQFIAENEAKRVGGKVRVVVWSTRKEYEDALKGELNGIKKVGLHFRNLQHSSFLSLSKFLRRISFVDVGSAIRAARVVKDADEISKIRKACAITEKTFSNILDEGLLKTGVTESKISAEISYYFLRHGASDAFPSICAFGANSAIPHHSTGAAMLKRGDFVLLDYGSAFQKYCSDFTRTMVFGKASKKQERMLEVVGEASTAAMEFAVEGENAADVHTAAARAIDKSEFKGKFIHATGHSVGLEVHDGYGFSSEEFALREGMVFTIEPGVYEKGFGGVRIEDMVLVKKGKCDLLTKFATFPRI